jgi:hypothetical protein
MMVAALAEDPCGFAQHHLPAALESLCALHIVLGDFRDLLRRLHPLGAVHNAPHPPFLLDGTDAARALAHGRHHTSSAQVQRARLHASANLGHLEAATDAALTRLVRAYRDIIESYLNHMPPLHAALVKDKLKSAAPSRQ